MNPHPSYSFYPPSQQNPSILFANARPRVPNINAANLQHDSTSSPNLSVLIESFRQLTKHAESAIAQISSFLKVDVGDDRDSDSEISQCPFNPQHRMPPAALFRHYLNCPSSPAVLDADDIISSLRYPETLKTLSKSSNKENQGFKIPDGQDNDICISLESEDFRSLGSSFFYKDAPGVVALELKSDRDIDRSMCVIPKVLASEFFSDDTSFDTLVELLPSEYWALSREVAGWNGFPRKVSFVVLQASLGFRNLKESGLVNWVLKNSVDHLVVIDISMARHICGLMRLCLKAIFRESVMLYSRQKKDYDSSGKSVYPEGVSFDCRCLFESAGWCASLLAVLYGRERGKKFAVDILKRAFVASGAAIQRGSGHKSVIKESNSDLCENNSEEQRQEKLDSVLHQLTVSEVASAVSALHERSMLEETIRGMRSARGMSKSQMLTEYEAAVKNAAEERRKRPNYKPLIEHDSLQLQRPSNEESKKHKTREELLAEERDYKRRRMSYRGKKVKRTPVQVLRDIINAHMEDIKLADGICLIEKGSEELSHCAGQLVPADSYKAVRSDSTHNSEGFSNNNQHERKYSSKHESYTGRCSKIAKSDYSEFAGSSSEKATAIRWHGRNEDTREAIYSQHEDKHYRSRVDYGNRHRSASHKRESSPSHDRHRPSESHGRYHDEDQRSKKHSQSGSYDSHKRERSSSKDSHSYSESHGIYHNYHRDKKHGQSESHSSYRREQSPSHEGHQPSESHGRYHDDYRGKMHSQSDSYDRWIP